MSAELPEHLPTVILEQRATEQRQRIHHSVGQLKTSLRETVRRRLDMESYARAHLWQLVTGASLLALIGGYGAASVFTRR